MPLTITMIMTRVMMGSKYPAGSSVVCRIDFLPSLKVSWNPLLPVELVTCTLSSALVTSASAGTGTPGPISSESWMLPAI